MAGQSAVEVRTGLGEIERSGIAVHERSRWLDSRGSGAPLFRAARRRLGNDADDCGRADGLGWPAAAFRNTGGTNELNAAHTNQPGGGMRASLLYKIASVTL